MAIAWLPALFNDGPGTYLIFLLFFGVLGLLALVPILLLKKLGLGRWIQRRFYRLQATNSLKAARQGQHGGFDGSFQIRIDEDGLKVVHNGIETEVAWKNLEGVELTVHHLFLMTHTTHAYVVPATAFESPAQAGRFFTAAREWGTVEKPTPIFSSSV